MARCGGCDVSWSGLGMAHCSGCHETFSGVTGFDRHQAGDKSGRFRRGECSDPSKRGLVKDDRGVWVSPATDRRFTGA